MSGFITIEKARADLRKRASEKQATLEAIASVDQRTIISTMVLQTLLATHPPTQGQGWGKFGESAESSVDDAIFITDILIAKLAGTEVPKRPSTLK